MPRGAKTRLARAMGVDPATIKKIFRGERALKVDELPKIEKFLKQQVEAANQNTRGTAPMFGYVAAAGESISLEAQDVRRRVPIHPAQAEYASPGVVEVLGESMYPRYKPRELVYFVFGLAPRRGDDAIIQLSDGSAMLKEYVMQKDGRTFLKEYHPEERQFSIESTGLKLHAVVGRG